MENLNTYKFIGKIALEYRLSLENICKLMKKEPTEENKKKVYELIVNSCEQNSRIVQSYRYLFNYETINESEEISANAYKAARLFIMQYNEAKNSKNEAMTNFVLRKLTKTDRDFQQLQKKELYKPLTVEDATTIAKYRIKYCISRENMSSLLNIGDSKLKLGESKIQDEILKNKVDLALEYQKSMLLRDKRKLY